MSDKSTEVELKRESQKSCSYPLNSVGSMSAKNMTIPCGNNNSAPQADKDSSNEIRATKFDFG